MNLLLKENNELKTTMLTNIKDLLFKSVKTHKLLLIIHKMQ